MLKNIAEILITLAFLYCLSVFSFSIAEYLYSKINLFPNVESKSIQKSKVDKDTIYAENYSPYIHFDTSNKCKKILLKR